jgi:hypothetical protein
VLHRALEVGACHRQMNIIRKPIKSWVNKRGDGQFTPNHQSSDNDRNDIQVSIMSFSLSYTQA